MATNQTKPKVEEKSKKKSVYSCGCKVVPVDEKRDKKKCVKHGVE